MPSTMAETATSMRIKRHMKTEIIAAGGGRSTISQRLDDFLHHRGWSEKSFDIRIVVDGREIPTPTHKIDNFKNEVGLEVKWNNKTEFYDRGLNNFRLLKELRVLSVGVMVTRMSELQKNFNSFGPKIGPKYGASTTHWNKLIPKVDWGGAGGCPLLLIGITERCLDLRG